MLLVNEPLLDGNEMKYLAECIKSGWISSGGPFVTQFESSFAQYTGRAYGIAVCNGSCALDVAIAALCIGEGDEVIMPSFTIVSCAHAILRAGAKPVLVDSDTKTWNMCVETIERLITPRTRAIMAVHLYGLPVNMDIVLDIAARHNLFVIEDAAQMHGQTFNKKRCGSFGTISTFSFYSNKTITTGEGGMVLTNDEKIAERCRSLRNLCFGDKQRFVHESMGWNYRMTNLQAAVGCAQLERIDFFIRKKKSIGALYNELLSGSTFIQLPLADTPFADNIYWIYGMLLTANAPVTVPELTAKLAKAGIETRPFFTGMHEQPVFHSMGLFTQTKLPGAEYLSRNGFYIPCGLAITEEQQRFTASTLLDVLKHG